MAQIVGVAKRYRFIVGGERYQISLLGKNNGKLIRNDGSVRIFQKKLAGITGANTRGFTFM